MILFLGEIFYATFDNYYVNVVFKLLIIGW